MEKAQKAWKLWRLLHDLSETLWEQYESEFMDFCIEENTQSQKTPSAKETDLPF